MTKEKNGKYKNDKTAPAKTLLQKRAAKEEKRREKNKPGAE